MIKRTLTAVALATVLAAPAFAQQPNMQQPPSNIDGAMPKQSVGASKAGFVANQSANEWRGSKLIGATVYGPSNESIGEINDVIIDGNGKIKAAVVGVGGFLGVGEKDVALPFESLNVARKQNSASIDKVTVSYTKDDLKNAPKFAYFQPDGSSTQTTGSSTGTRNLGNGNSMK